MRSLYLIIAGLLLCAPVHGQKGGNFGKQTASTNDYYVKLGGNDVGMWLSNNGSMSHNPSIDGPGFEWPLGSGKHLIYEEGLLLGGICDGSVHVGGSTYHYGLQAGPIRADGSASNPYDPRSRVFRLAILNSSDFYSLPYDVQQQFAANFHEWPVEDGAPWIDADGNGLYEPDLIAWLMGDQSHDQPLFPGQEIAWYVSNDLDASRARGLYGTMPMGLEVQVFAWSGMHSDVAERTVFTQYTIINKGRYPVRDAFISRWVDPDVGDAGDDLVGVDTTLCMMYAYNGKPSDDVYGAAPPAVGHVWLQTPIVRSHGDVARWNNGWRQGYRNIEPSAFAFYINSDPVYQDPDLGSEEGAQQMYKYMNGVLPTGSQFIDPLTQQLTYIPLAGDPVTGRGWIDGIVHAADDRRMLYSCGPFQFEPGDTQQVVMATMVGLGDSPLLALQDLRRSARMLLREYNEGVGILAVEDANYSIDWPQSDSFVLTLSADIVPGGEAVGIVRGPGGDELLRFPLHDDGAHGDGAAYDGRFAGSVYHAALSSGGDLYVAKVVGNIIRVEAPVGSMLPLVADLRVKDGHVISDHFDFNGEASPGENVVIGCTLENRGTRALGAWTLITAPFGVPATASLADMVAAGEQHSIDGLQAGLEGALQFDIPATAVAGANMRIPVTLMSEQYCLWSDTIVIPVSAPSRRMYTGLFAHTAGKACGTLGYTVADPAALVSGRVRITVEGDVFAEKTLTMRDTQGKILRSGIPVPDKYGHRSPTVAGLRLLIGTTTAYLAMHPNGFPLTEPLQYAFEPPERAWFTPYSGFLTYGFDFFGSAILDIFSMPTVELVFDRSIRQNAYAYLRGTSPNYEYQGYFECQVTAWDTSNPHNPRQLGLAFIEQNGGAKHDNTWYPSTNPADREYLFILDESYSDVPNPALMVPFLEHAEEMPILYALWPQRISNDHTYTDGDRFRITPRIPISNRDEYLLDLSLVGAEDAPPPLAPDVTLYPNHPNPFTGSTSVVYRIGEATHVELAVYDALGRKLRTLASGWREAGTHVSPFSAGDAAPGVYFYRLTAGGRTVTQRMLLLR